MAFIKSLHLHSLTACFVCVCVCFWSKQNWQASQTNFISRHSSNRFGSFTICALLVPVAHSLYWCLAASTCQWDIIWSVVIGTFCSDFSSWMRSICLAIKPKIVFVNWVWDNTPVVVGSVYAFTQSKLVAAFRNILHCCRWDFCICDRISWINFDVVISDLCMSGGEQKFRSDASLVLVCSGRIAVTHGLLPKLSPIICLRHARYHRWMSSLRDFMVSICVHLCWLFISDSPWYDTLPQRLI